MGKIIGALAIVLLFGGASLAEAQCAWVLWQNVEFIASAPSGAGDIRISPPPDSPVKGRLYTEWNNADWTPNSSYTSLQNCEAHARPLSTPWPTEVKYGDARNMYRCLPDTIDPRGPKGGGR